LLHNVILSCCKLAAPSSEQITELVDVPLLFTVPLRSLSPTQLERFLILRRDYRRITKLVERCLRHPPKDAQEIYVLTKELRRLGRRYENAMRAILAKR